jgi:hypothetical protein
VTRPGRWERIGERREREEREEGGRVAGEKKKKKTDVWVPLI